MTSAKSISHGMCDERFAKVRSAFEGALASGDETGASVHVIIDGEPVVHLWGGHADRAAARAWSEDTRGVVFSVTKGVTALAVHMLIARGLVELDDPVARHWPEFAANGKSSITIRQVLSHTSGLPAFTQPVEQGVFYDWNAMVAMIEDMSPVFEPGSAQAYQMFSFGWILGEIVRRVSGKSLTSFAKEEIALPSGSAFEIGLETIDRPLIAELLVVPPGPEDLATPFFAEVARDPEGVSALAMLNIGGHLATADSDEALRAALGASGGVGSARDIARIYAPLSKPEEAEAKYGLRNIDLQRMSRIETAAPLDMTLRGPLRFASGFMVSTDNRHLGLNSAYEMRLGRAAFGMPGFGGNIGFADPEHRLAFGYTTAKVRNTVLLNEVSQTLVDRVYEALGCRSDQSGYWN